MFIYIYNLETLNDQHEGNNLICHISTEYQPFAYNSEGYEETEKAC